MSFISNWVGKIYGTPAVYPPERRQIYGQIAVYLSIWGRYTATHLFISLVSGDEQQSSVQ